MKAVVALMVAGALAALSGCSGKASPEARITCDSVDGVTTFTNNLAMIQKTVTSFDAGLGGEVPANGITATVISPVDSIQICEHDCLDGSGNFDTEQEVSVDDNGIFLYTIGVDPAFPFDGEILEVFSATDTCSTNITIS